MEEQPIYRSNLHGKSTSWRTGSQREVPAMYALSREVSSLLDRLDWRGSRSFAYVSGTEPKGNAHFWDVGVTLRLTVPNMSDLPALLSWLMDFPSDSDKAFQATPPNERDYRIEANIARAIELGLFSEAWRDNAQLMLNEIRDSIARRAYGAITGENL